MKPRKVTDRVDWIGAIDWDSRLFDSLVPLPEGTSYNAYVVRGSERTAVIDTVEPRFQDAFLRSLAGIERVDYIVSNHAEQDHSGALPALAARFPEAEILCSTKAKRILLDLLPLPAERIRAVKDGESVTLGDRTLRFIHTPWVHWPETMSTWLEEEKVLFSCDLFGSHLATSDLFAIDAGAVMPAAKRYYAEIMMPYRRHVAANLDILADLDIGIIAPSHGPLHDRPAAIIDAYRGWATAAPLNRAVVAYVSMHDSTRRMVDRLVGGLIDRGVGVNRFDLTVTDLGQLAMALVDAGTIVVATPTVLEGPHPLAASAAYTVNMLKPKARFLGAVGSFAWNSKAIMKLKVLLEDMEAEWLPPVVGRGHPGTEAAQGLDGLADTIAQRHRQSGFA